MKVGVDVPWNTMKSRDENVVLGFIFSLQYQPMGHCQTVDEALLPPAHQLSVLQCYNVTFVYQINSAYYM